ncbi:hypothetical protein PTKU46_86000 [Paraburkholderia terrae]
MVGRAIQDAVKAQEMPEGGFSLLFGAGRKLGEALVSHPVIKAVGLTGSPKRACLERIASAPYDPITVFAKTSSINPVFLLSGALANRAEAIGKASVDSLTMGAAQGRIVAYVTTTHRSRNESPTLPRFLLNRNTNASRCC